VLLLDEPTNHLDLEAIRALTEALRVFEGTAVFVTHDRNMVDRVAPRVIEMSYDGVREISHSDFEAGRFLEKHATYVQPQAWYHALAGWRGGPCDSPLFGSRSGGMRERVRSWGIEVSMGGGSISLPFVS